MKKRAMKKWIPQGDYCYNGKKSCKWWQYIKTVKRDRSNCEFSKTCKEECWTKPDNSCKERIQRCEYLKYTDCHENSLLWDSCKECGEHTQTKEEYLWDLSAGNCKINKRMKS